MNGYKKGSLDHSKNRRKIGNKRRTEKKYSSTFSYKSGNQAVKKLQIIKIKSQIKREILKSQLLLNSEKELKATQKQHQQNHHYFSSSKSVGLEEVLIVNLEFQDRRS